MRYAPGHLPPSPSERDGDDAGAGGGGGVGFRGVARSAEGGVSRRVETDATKAMPLLYLHVINVFVYPLY